MRRGPLFVCCAVSERKYVPINESPRSNFRLAEDFLASLTVACQTNYSVLQITQSCPPQFWIEEPRCAGEQLEERRRNIVLIIVFAFLLRFSISRVFQNWLLVKQITQSCKLFSLANYSVSPPTTHCCSSDLSRARLALAINRWYTRSCWRRLGIVADRKPQTRHA